MSACLAAAAVYLLAGLLQGLVGFGASLLAMPVLLFFIDVKTAVPLCILDGLVLTAFMGFQLRGHVQLAKLGPLLFGLPLGILAGVSFLAHVDGMVVMFLLGLLITGYALYSLLASPAPRRLHPAWGVLAGFMSGAISAGFSGGGPPTIIYSQLAGWKRDQFKATLAVFFIVVTVFSSTGHALAGLITPQVLVLTACSAPCVVLGAVLGLKWSQGVDEASFRRYVLFLLIMLGVATSLRAVM